MTSRRDRLAGQGRYDPAAPRRAVRTGRQKGVTIFIPAAELEAAGIDPNGPPPSYVTRGFKEKGRRVIVNLTP